MNENRVFNVQISLFSNRHNRWNGRQDFRRNKCKWQFCFCFKNTEAVKITLFNLFYTKPFQKENFRSVRGFQFLAIGFNYEEDTRKVKHSISSNWDYRYINFLGNKLHWYISKMQNLSETQVIVIVALSLTLITLLLLCIGVIAPYWVYREASGTRYYQGLWQSCTHVDSYEECVDISKSGKSINLLFSISILHLSTRYVCTHSYSNYET